MLKGVLCSEFEKEDEMGLDSIPREKDKISFSFAKWSQQRTWRKLACFGCAEYQPRDGTCWWCQGEGILPVPFEEFEG